ncbi:MAG TPA: VWA domain-containing protein [Polyangiaceae bacterium]|nr:VWA domain-containing protein [Polyangiaceae bacterium]
MKNSAIFASAIAIAVALSGIAACGSSNDAGSAALEGSGGNQSGGSGGSLGMDSGVAGYWGGAGTGYGGSGAGNYGGEGNRPGEGAPDAGPDAQADAGDAGDAPDACAALDDSKDAVFFVSADDSNSMASPAIARDLIQRGQQVPGGLIRTYEFLNYYNVGYAPAEAGSLGIVPEMKKSDSDGSFELTIGVASQAAPASRRPMVLTFVLDTSGSMGGSPIQLEREVVQVLAGELQQGDNVSMVTWSTSQTVLLDSYVVTGPNDAKLLGIANSLSANGGTDLSAGLNKGYALAQKNFESTKLNRVIVISDGVANVGQTDEKIIGQGALLNDGDGIYLVGVGVGEGMNDMMMDTVTDAGRGAYVFVDSSAEAKRMFDTRFDEVMDVAARGVQVELRLPWYMGIEKFYGEEYSTNPKEIEPQHLAPGDAMVFSQVVRACSSTEYSSADPIEVIARWQTPVSHLEKEVSVQSTFGALLATQTKYQDKAAAIIAYAEALKDPLTAKDQLTATLAKIAAVDPTNTDPELSEIKGLIQKALTLY